jgi:glycosyltransferase involved in cell wall biosynthesis
MKILQVSTSDRGGGAERSAVNLQQAFRERGHESWLAVGFRRSADADVFTLPNDGNRNSLHCALDALRQRHHAGKRRIPGFGRMLAAAQSLAEPRRTLDRWRGREDFCFPGTASVLRMTPAVPDIVHLHNLHGGYFDLRMLPSISRSKPTILNVRDGWLTTGHCAFGLGCQRWQTGCGACPDLTLFPAIPRDATALNWQRKRDILSACRLHVTAPSEWMMRVVRKSIIEPAALEHRVIPNGVDSRVFCPGRQDDARAQLGIPLGAKVILASAFGLRTNPWKDHRTLRLAFERLGGQEWASPIHIIATGDASAMERIGNIEVRFLPFVDDPCILAQYYRAADLFVHAAHVESFGNVLLEARACGTAIVTTATGAIPEHVGAEDGRLVPVGDSQALAEAIATLLRDDGLRRHVAAAGRERVLREFTLERQADRFLHWYEELLNA